MQNKRAIIVCMGFVFRSTHCSLPLLIKGIVFAHWILPGFPSKGLSKPVKNEWELKFLSQLRSLWLDFSSVFQSISSSPPVQSRTKSWHLPNWAGAVIHPCFLADQLQLSGEKKLCHGQLWKVCPREMFIPNPAVLPSQTPSCCDPAQLWTPGDASCCHAF